MDNWSNKMTKENLEKAIKFRNERNREIDDTIPKIAKEIENLSRVISKLVLEQRENKNALVVLQLELIDGLKRIEIK